MSSKQPMTVEKIIELCGGEHAVAHYFKLANIYLVRRWVVRGIPLKNWSGLIDLARERGVKLTGEQLWSANAPIISENA
jgi:hypothetical protein